MKIKVWNAAATLIGAAGIAIAGWGILEFLDLIVGLL